MHPIRLFTVLTYSLLFLLGCNPVWNNGWYGSHGEWVEPHDQDVDPDEYNAEVSRSLALWEDALAGEGIDCDISEAMDGMVVVWHEKWFRSWQGFRKGKASGRYQISIRPHAKDRIELARNVEIGETETEPGELIPMTMEHTSLGHEISHRVLHYCGQGFTHGCVNRVKDECVDRLVWWRDTYGTPE